MILIIGFNILQNFSSLQVPLQSLYIHQAWYFNLFVIQELLCSAGAALAKKQKEEPATIPLQQRKCSSISIILQNVRFFRGYHYSYPVSIFCYLYFMILQILVVHPLQTFFVNTSVSIDYFNTVLFVLFVLDLAVTAAAQEKARRRLFVDLMAVLGSRPEMISVGELILVMEGL